MRPLHINQERFGEDVRAHELGVTMVKVTEWPVGNLGQKHLIDPMGPAEVADGGIPARFHDLNGGGIILHPQELGFLFEK
jgi:hypothetical protein